MKLIDPHILAVLERAWTNPFTTKSNFARNHANHIAAAACENLITTKNGPNEFSSVWKITALGAAKLEKIKENQNVY